VDDDSLIPPGEAWGISSLLLLALSAAPGSAGLSFIPAAALDPKRTGQQLWSLATTSLKCYTQFADKVGSLGSSVLTMFHFLQLCTKMVNVFAAETASKLLCNTQQPSLPGVAGDSSSSRSSTRSGMAGCFELLRCWLVLLGRTLLVTQRAVACQEQNRAMLVPVNLREMRMQALTSVLEAARCVKDAAQHQSQQPAAAAAGGLTIEVQQQLQEQAASLISSCAQELQDGGVTVQSRSLLQGGRWLCGTSTQQQMQQLGQVLTAHLPLSCCCNNPGCCCLAAVRAEAGAEAWQQVQRLQCGKVGGMAGSLLWHNCCALICACRHACCKTCWSNVAITTATHMLLHFKLLCRIECCNIWLCYCSTDT
jgi:hypothetical protein